MTLLQHNRKKSFCVRYRGQCHSSQILNRIVQNLVIVSRNAYGHTYLHANPSFVFTKYEVGDFYYTLTVKVEKSRSPPNPVFDSRIQKPEERMKIKCNKNFFKLLNFCVKNLIKWICKQKFLLAFLNEKLWRNKNEKFI